MHEGGEGEASSEGKKKNWEKQSSEAQRQNEKMPVSRTENELRKTVRFHSEE